MGWRFHELFRPDFHLYVAVTVKLHTLVNLQVGIDCLRIQIKRYYAEGAWLWQTFRVLRISNLVRGADRSRQEDGLEIAETVRRGESNFEGLLGLAIKETLFGRDFKSRSFRLFRLKRCEVELERILLLVKALVLVNGDLEDILV